MIGKRLKTIRKEKGLSQKALAELLTTSSGYISEIEQGKTIPGGKFLHSLNRVFLVSIDWLLTGDGEPYLKKDSKTPVDSSTTASNQAEQQHMDLVKEFIDKQRAFNIDKELVELEKLAPEVFERVETYIKASADAIKTIKRKDSESCLDRRRGRRRVSEDPDKIPDGVERRSGEDRRKAS